MRHRHRLRSNSVRLGVSSWTFPWAIGVSGYPQPARPIRLSDFIDKAAALKVSVVQIADNLPLHKLDAKELRDVRDQAVSLGIKIEIGTRGVEHDHLLLYLNLALQLDAVLIRTLTHTVES